MKRRPEFRCSAMCVPKWAERVRPAMGSSFLLYLPTRERFAGTRKPGIVASDDALGRNLDDSLNFHGDPVGQGADSDSRSGMLAGITEYFYKEI